MKKLIVPIVFIPLGVIFCNAQQSINASGGNSSGSGGSSSYTIGQIDYSSKGSPVQITEGVQQPYEIVSLAVSETSGEKNISLYPNPVKDVLFVDFNEEKYANAQYILFDSQGRTLKKGIFTQKKTELDFSTLPQSVYIIQIFQDSKNIKTYKIIKK